MTMERGGSFLHASEKWLAEGQKNRSFLPFLARYRKEENLRFPLSLATSSFSTFSPVFPSGTYPARLTPSPLTPPLLDVGGCHGSRKGRLVIAVAIACLGKEVFFPEMLLNECLLFFLSPTRASSDSPAFLGGWRRTGRSKEGGVGAPADAVLGVGTAVAFAARAVEEDGGVQEDVGRGA